MNPVMRCAATLAATLSWAGVGAAPLSDPTRPPVSLGAPPAGATGAVPAGAAVAKPAPAPEPLRVQSVQLPREGAPSALVDGRLVRVGDRLGAAQVVAIDAHGVQLRAPGGALRRLALLEALPAAAVVPVPPTRLAAQGPHP